MQKKSTEKKCPTGSRKNSKTGRCNKIKSRKSTKSKKSTKSNSVNKSIKKYTKSNSVKKSTKKSTKSKSVKKSTKSNKLKITFNGYIKSNIKHDKPKKEGICIHYFSHRGIGRINENVKDIYAREQQLKKYKRDNGDIDYISCHTDKKKAIRKYNMLKNKKKSTKSTKKITKKSTKSKK